MTTPDSDAQFDEFADLDAKLDDLFGEVAETNSSIKEMTQQFFKGSGDMKAWDQVDQASHAAVDESHQEEVDQEWDDFADAFFGEEDATEKPKSETFVANQTVRFDFGGGDGAPSLNPAIQAAVESQDTYNVFLRKMANPKQREAAIPLISELAGIDTDEATAMTKKPFIKVLIGVHLSEAEAAQARFKEAGLIATYKKCV